MAFAGLTGDYSQVHTDEEFCKKTEFGTRIAHGLLGLSIAQGLSWRTNYTQGTGVASLQWDKWVFKHPIFFGDTVRVPLALVEQAREQEQAGCGNRQGIRSADQSAGRSRARGRACDNGQKTPKDGLTAGEGSPHRWASLAFWMAQRTFGG